MQGSSAEVIASIAREQQQVVEAQISAIDSKATTLIGFVGVLLGLLFGSGPATDNWNILLTIGAALLGLATLVLGYAILPRKYRVNPSISGLRAKMDGRPAEQTHRVVARSIERGIKANAEVLSRKALAVRWATVVVIVAVVLISGRLIYSFDTEKSPPTLKAGQKR